VIPLSIVGESSARRTVAARHQSGTRSRSLAAMRMRDCRSAVVRWSSTSCRTERTCVGAVASTTAYPASVSSGTCTTTRRCASATAQWWSRCASTWALSWTEIGVTALDDRTLIEVGATAEEYLRAMHRLEASGSTYIGGGVAIPHATDEFRVHVRRSAIAWCSSRWSRTSAHSAGRVFRYPDLAVDGDHRAVTTLHQAQADTRPA
jgi:hypothetical protein